MASSLLAQLPRELRSATATAVVTPRSPRATLAALADRLSDGQAYDLATPLPVEPRPLLKSGRAFRKASTSMSS